MKNILAISICLFCQLFISSSFAQTKKVTVLGSSTAFGTGATPGFGWVDLLTASFNKNKTDGIDTIVDNRALGGYTTYHSMPTGNFVPNRPTPDEARNVTFVLNNSPRPDIVIINYPTNDIANGYSAKEMMDNLRLMFQTLNDNGIRTFITTTQPRELSYEQRTILKQLVDSVQSKFGVYSINFWDELVSQDGLNHIREEVSAGDGTHVNNLGHQLLFERVQAKNIFNGTTPPPNPGVTTRIEAENYNSMSGVAKENTSDAGGGQNVGYIDFGDWMDYSVNVSSAGGYAINLRVASPSGGQLQIKNASGIVLATVAIPNTGGWQNWQTVSANISLAAGVQTIRVQSTSNGWNFNWLEIAGNSAITMRTLPTNEVLSSAISSYISTYPNPVVSNFQLQVNNGLKGTVSVQVYDIQGRLQKQFALNKSNVGTYQVYLSIAELAAANYFVKVTMKGWTQTKQIIKH